MSKFLHDVDDAKAVAILPVFSENSRAKMYFYCFIIIMGRTSVYFCIFLYKLNNILQSSIKVSRINLGTVNYIRRSLD